jgi:hypothetical protein
MAVIPKTTLAKMIANIFSPLDNLYWLLQTVSLVLVGLTVVVGGLAIIAGKAANRRQATIILELQKSASDAKAAQQRVETDLSNAKTRQAEAESKLEEVRKRQNRRIANWTKFTEALKGKPRCDIEMREWPARR